MAQPQIGDTAPAFSIPSDGGGTVSLSDFKGSYLILYFYPRDDTPGCTTEAKGFSEIKDELAKLNTKVVGVSKDTVAKHDKFIAKHDLQVQLGADVEGQVVEDYGVWVEKSMYGKTSMGIQRATFLIGPDQTILETWPKARVKGHVEAVLDAVKQHAG
ncbi:peroxiredoxin [Litorimonas sp. RW-G-Af-16]|uniref:peroxiredoxin n=1 Tax=Litorimonas sp. RW-G-Af-16 TaxID=3241168 RepID=UPI00390C98F8